MFRKTALLLTLSLSALAFAGDPPTTDAKSGTKTEAKVEKSELDESLAQIAEDAGLSEKGLDKFKGAADKRQAKLDAWKESTDGQKLADLRKQLAVARKDKDDTRINSIEKQIDPLNKAYTDLRESSRGELLSTLTDKQQVKMLETALTRRVTKSLDDANLTADQKSKIETLCEDAIPDYHKEWTVEKDPMFRHLFGVQSRVVNKVKADLLTDAQRDAMKAARDEEKKQEKDKKEPTTKPAKEK